MIQRTSQIFTAFLVLWLLSFGLCGLEVAAASEGNISNTRKYAWSENAGWQNFRPTSAGVTVYSQYLSGFAWAENLGWVKLGSGSGPYANTDSSNWGVNRDSGTGILSGYGWSEIAGWINFAPTHSQIIIDPANGSFLGYAWSENVGWIHFVGVSPAYNVAVVQPNAITFNPPSCPAGGVITITGNNLLGAQSVTFGGTEATDFTVDSASMITATVGDGSTGKVAVTTPGGTAESAADFIFITPPEVITRRAFFEPPDRAVGGGRVISDGGSPVTARGVCWSTSPNPTIADSHTTDGSGIGRFQSLITGLTPDIDYHVRAYAINGFYTAYGADLVFNASVVQIPALTDWGMILFSLVVCGAAIGIIRRNRKGLRIR